MLIRLSPGSRRFGALLGAIIAELRYFRECDRTRRIGPLLVRMTNFALRREALVFRPAVRGSTFSPSGKRPGMVERHGRAEEQPLLHPQRDDDRGRRTRLAPG